MDPTDSAVGRSPVLRVSVGVRDGRGEAVLAAAREAAGDVPVVGVGPTGVEGSEPLVAATLDGRTALFGAVSPARARDVATSLDAGDLPTGDADAVVDHDPDAAEFPAPDAGPLAVGRRRVLARCGWAAPAAPADYGDLVSADGDAGAVADVGLLGRGRGDGSTDAPVAETWRTARGADGDPVVVVNANEADDRSLADETLLAGAPLDVLDGAVAVAEHVGAADVVVYLNAERDRLHERVRRAVEAARDDLPVAPQVVTGPDAFRAGEPTMALEAMEGADRVEARLRPPSPAEHGLYGRPTVVHTPRTLAQVRLALADPDAFDPDDADPGTRLVTATGDVEAPATVELPSGGSLATVRDAVSLDGDYGLACVGGQFGGLTRDLDVGPGARDLASADLGTNGVVELLNDERCPVVAAGRRARFAMDENCGRCVPCREGSKQLVDLLRNVYDGDYDAAKLRELARVMRESSTCDFGVAAARPVTTAMDEFEPDFRAHADGRCPSGTCTQQL